MNEARTKSAPLTSRDMLALYKGLMEEVKVRLAALTPAIRSAANSSHHPNERVLQTEFAYLQIRRICELTALAALLAHNELPEARTKKFIEEWNAGKLVDRLAQIGWSAFPFPIKLDADPGIEICIEPVPDQYVTIQRLKEIYNKCGTRLHAGMLAKILVGKRLDYNIDDLIEWSNGLHDLLMSHMIVLPNCRDAVMAHLNPPNMDVVVEIRAFPAGFAEWLSQQGSKRTPAERRQAIWTRSRAHRTAR